MIKLRSTRRWKDYAGEAESKNEFIHRRGIIEDA